jgi:hypothetical protein
MELDQQEPTPITVMLSQSWQISLSARDMAGADASGTTAYPLAKLMLW